MPTNTVLWGEYRALALELQEISLPLLLGHRRPVSLTTDLPAGFQVLGVNGVHAVQFSRAQPQPGRTRPSTIETVVLVTNALSVSCRFTATNVSHLMQGYPFAKVEVLGENRILNISSSGKIEDTISAMGTRAYRITGHDGVYAVELPPSPPSSPILLNGGFEQASSPGVPDGVCEQQTFAPALQFGPSPSRALDISYLLPLLAPDSSLTVHCHCHRRRPHGRSGLVFLHRLTSARWGLQCGWPLAAVAHRTCEAGRPSDDGDTARNDWQAV